MPPYAKSPSTVPFQAFRRFLWVIHCASDAFGFVVFCPTNPDECHPGRKASWLAGRAKWPVRPPRRRIGAEAASCSPAETAVPPGCRCRPLARRTDAPKLAYHPALNGAQPD